MVPRVLTLFGGALLCATAFSLSVASISESAQIQTFASSGRKGLPSITNCPDSLTFDHCSLASYQFEARYPANRTVTFVKISGLGTLIPETGQWSYSPTIADVIAHNRLVVAVVDNKTGRKGPSSEVNLIFTNIPPVFGPGSTSAIPTAYGDTAIVRYRTNSGDCDPISGFIANISPQLSGTYLLSSMPIVLRYIPDTADAGKTIVFTIGVTDGADTAFCQTTFIVDSAKPYRLRIQTTHGTYQGQQASIDVTLEEGSEEMSGFDFLFKYDNTALNLLGAFPDSSLFRPSPQGCGWEYFTFRAGQNGNCGDSSCPQGFLRVIAIAETNNGAIHPSCFRTTTPARLFHFIFLVSDNRTLECQFLPIQFVWTDCTDNTIMSRAGDKLFVSDRVFDSESGSDITNPVTGYPTFTGAQNSDCFIPNWRYEAVRFIDFVNGGIGVACADTIDPRGDVNLNDIPYEIADVMLFSRFFVYGMVVFTTDLALQIQATDVNGDGFTLSVEDFVYLIRMVTGDAVPITDSLPSLPATLHRNGTTLSIDHPVAAGLITANGNVSPQLLAPGMEMLYNYDGETTRILIWWSESNLGGTFVGDFINVPAPIVSYDFASYEGFKIDAAYDCCWGMRGDANGDGRAEPSVLDVAALTAYVMEKSANICLTEADVNGDGTLSISDAAYLIAYLFNKGPAPVSCP